MTISVRLYLTFGIIVLCTGIYSAFNMFVSKDNLSQFDLYRHATTENDLVSSFIDGAFSVHLVVTEYLVTGDSDLVEKFDRDFAALLDNSEIIQQKSSDKDILEKFASIHANLIAYAELFRKSVRLNKYKSSRNITIPVGGDSYRNEQLEVGKKILNGVAPKILKDAHYVLYKTRASQMASRRLMEYNMGLSQRITFISSFLVIVISLIISVLFSRMLRNRMYRVNVATEALSTGTLDIEVPDTDKQDEIGAIARALLVFKENMIETKCVEAHQKDQEKRLQEARKLELHQLADSFEKRVRGIVKSVAAASTQLANTAEKMSSDVEQSSQMSQSAVQASSETSNNVQSVASAVEEMFASSKDISTKTTRSTEIARESVSLTQDGDRSAAALLQAVDRVQSAVDIINTIAGQINLLALNATIESARAGDAGRGFAVVAGEVKHLASQTANATHEIASVLEEMNSASSDITTVLDRIKESVNSVSDVAASISSSIDEQSKVTSDIASNMNTASKGANIIASSLSNVNDSTQAVQSSSGQVLGAAKELSKQAEALDVEIRGFLSEVRG